MAQPSRSTQIARLQKVLKKHYKPVAADPGRTVMEHTVFACCLENAHFDVAEEAFAALAHNFFDWNEVRVSTVRELAEEMPRLPDAQAAAARVKRILQSVFEGSYSFDLEELRKLNLGTATEKLSKYAGVTPFVAAYVVQSALSGHAIAIDEGTGQVLQLVGVITEQEARNSQVAGLERAVAKPKGVEFASQLHQLGADFIANPYSPALHEILKEIEPSVADRLPTRRPKKPEPAAAAASAADAKKDKKKSKKAAEEKPAESKARSAKAAEPPAAEAATPPAQPKPEAKSAEAKPAEGKPAKSKGEEKKEHKETKASKSAEAKPAKAAEAKVEPEVPAEPKAPAKPGATKPPAAHEEKAERKKHPAKEHKEPKELKEPPAAAKPVEHEEPAKEHAPAKKKPSAAKKDTPEKESHSEASEEAKPAPASVAAGLSKRKPR